MIELFAFMGIVVLLVVFWRIWFAIIAIAVIAVFALTIMETGAGYNEQETPTMQIYGLTDALNTPYGVIVFTNTFSINGSHLHNWMWVDDELKPFSETVNPVWAADAAKDRERVRIKFQSP